MDNPPGTILVHGYSGRPEDLEPVRQVLVEQYGSSAVRILRLPGHVDGRIPRFDADRIGRDIDDAVDACQDRHRRLILIGHSTGGNLLLDHIWRRQTVPALLVLTATPSRINGADLHRWEAHHANGAEISLTSLAHLVSHVNRTGTRQIGSAFPVLLIHGDADRLVDSSCTEWPLASFAEQTNCVRIPHAGHNPFIGPGSEMAIAAVSRAVADVAEHGSTESQSLETLAAMDADVAAFVTARPRHARHLLHSPAARQALDLPLAFPTVTDTAPVRLNIEVTTRCNLACGHCARTRDHRPAMDMDRRRFGRLIDRVPQAFKITLVGLGEPTLHPNLPELVGMAAGRGHRVGLVTNAMVLDKALSRRLVAAGLGSLAISLDSVDPRVAASVRPGSDVRRILGNLRTFMQVCDGAIPTAVFTAVSTATVSRLPALADTIGALQVTAWMLSDLNFGWNRSKTVWKNGDRTDRRHIEAAIRRAFMQGMPVLSVRALEALGLSRRYAGHLIRSSSAVAERSPTHSGCLSPWQTLPIDVNGGVTVCDCQPTTGIGNLLETPLDRIWNGPAMQRQRRRMRSTHPPAPCRGCPRF